MKISEVKDIVNQIGRSNFENDGKITTIKEFVKQNINEKKEDFSESYEKFCYFVPNLLLRGEKGTIRINDERKYISNILADKLLQLDINDENWSNIDHLHLLVKDSFYRIRYGNPVGKIINEAKSIFDENYSQNFNQYLEKAANFFEKYKETHIVRGYFYCEFKDIFGVGLKTRDLGLSIFLDSVMAIDRHLMRIPKMLGITELSDLPDNIWDKTPGNNYSKIAHFLIKLSYKIDFTPYEFDRYFWNFASEICDKKNPNCSNCNVIKCSKR